MSDYQKPCGYPVMDCALGVYVTKCENRIEELEAENEKLLKALDIYERERNRFKHAKPEMTEEQYDEAMYELDDMFLAGEIGYADYIKGFRDLNEKYREGETE